MFRGVNSYAMFFEVIEKSTQLSASLDGAQF